MRAAWGDRVRARLIRGAHEIFDEYGAAAIARRHAAIARRFQGAAGLLIAGFWNGHDASCCLMRDGRVMAHIELERYLRLKQVQGDALYVMREYLLAPRGLRFEDIDLFATCFPPSTFQRYASLYRPPRDRLVFVGHHTAHAAHAFYSSHLPEAMMLTVDGGGMEGDTLGALGRYAGEGGRLRPLQAVRRRPNIGGVWSRCTRYVFRLQTGGSSGHQAGTVMAMAALGDPQRFAERFYRALTVENAAAEARPPGHDWYRRDLFLPIDPEKDPPHPYWAECRRLADRDEQTRFDLAAGLQAATERLLRELVEDLREETGGRFADVGFAGGVALNAVANGMLMQRLPWLRELFVPPVPADDGLSLGAAQYLTHQLLRLPRGRFSPFFSPYLGTAYDRAAVLQALETMRDVLSWQPCTADELVQRLAAGRIISVFDGPSESGRRALGHRSILASPLQASMKALVNDKVKHRQWFRPFAPAVPEEQAAEWFEGVRRSPYMSAVFPATPRAKALAPAIVHYDGSARVQTVSRDASPWFHHLLGAFGQVTGVPILLNTSFNDQEPIVETPEDAVRCFLGTAIDHLYFVEAQWLVSRRPGPLVAAAESSLPQLSTAAPPG